MKKTMTLSALALMVAASAQAEVRINGFANLIGGMTGSDENLYGYDDTFSFKPESLFAIQVSGDVNSKMTATGQLVARGTNDYDPDFEWAYLTYNATDKLSISAGRLRLPLFSYSASKDVGYSYHWINAPRAVYEVPFNNLDGVRVDYSTFSGDWEYNVSFSTGTFSGTALGADNSGDNVLVFSAEASYEWFKIRAVAGVGKTTIDLASSDRAEIQAIANGLNTMRSLGFAELENNLQVRDDSGQFLGLSAQVDKFDWFVSAEITSINADNSFLAKDIAYYVTAGIRQGAWTPSLTYQKFESDAELKYQDQINQIAASGLPQTAVVQLTQLAIGLQMSQDSEYDVLSASLRYDFDTNVAFKADISKYSDDMDNSLDATLLRFGVNYVF